MSILSTYDTHWLTGRFSSRWLGTTAIMFGLLWAAVTGKAGENVTLVRDGKPAATIVLSDQPTRSAQLAAAELQDHVRAMTGATLPIVRTNEWQADGRTPVFVGESGTTRMLGLISSRFAPQEWLVRITANAIFLIGRDDNEFGPITYDQTGAWPGFDFFCRIGSVYAVYDFLEKECGVRWYMPTELGRIIPQRATLTVPARERRDQPWCSYRYIGRQLWPDPADPGAFDTMGVRRHKRQCSPRDNTLYTIRTRQGGEAYAVNHSVYGYHARFATNHPDWWVDGVPGKNKQLRYNKQEVVDQVAADAIEYFNHSFTERRQGLKEGGASGRGDYFGAVPLDNRDYGTECDPPLQPERQQIGKFGSGTASDYIFTWVNRVAEKVGAVHPDAYISTIAYAGMFLPPHFPMRPNVAVTVCMADGWEEGGYGMQTLREWRRAASNLRTWEYHYSWGGFPALRPQLVADYIKRLQAMGLQGMFMEMGDMGSGMTHIDYTITWKLLTDSSADVKTILDEYYKLFYGPAEKPMRRFWTSLQTASDEVHGKAMSNSRNKSWIKGATEARMQEWEQELAEAARLAPDAPYSTRVALIRDVVMKSIREDAAAQQKIAVAPLPKLLVKKAASAPVIDGQLDDPAWKSASVTADFRGFADEPVSNRTYTMAAYDASNLYVAIYCAEPCVKDMVLGHVTSSAGLCQDSSVEMNVDPTPQTSDYIQIMLNANSVSWIWWREKYTPSTTPDLGIIAKAWKGEKEWTCEFSIPFQKIAGQGPAVGETWAVNLMRNRYLESNQVAKGQVMSVWAVPFSTSFHVKDRFGTFQFDQ